MFWNLSSLGLFPSIPWLTICEFFCFAGLRDSCLRRTRLYEKPEESVFLFFFFSHCIIILMQQSSMWHLSASVSVSVLLNLLQDCESDLMSVLMCLPRSSREFVSKICLAGPDRTLTANLISLVVTKELSCCDLEHQSVFEGISSKWRNTGCNKSDKISRAFACFQG